MWWLSKFLFGMFLAYLILSPRLRHFVFRLIFKRHKPMPDIEARETEDDITEDTPPSNQTPTNTYKGGVEVDDSQVKDWLDKNPNLTVTKRKE